MVRTCVSLRTEVFFREACRHWPSAWARSGGFLIVMAKSKLTSESEQRVGRASPISAPLALLPPYALPRKSEQPSGNHPVLPALTTTANPLSSRTAPPHFRSLHSPTAYHPTETTMNAAAKALERTMDDPPVEVTAEINNPSQRTDGADPSGEKMQVRARNSGSSCAASEVL